MKWEAELLAEMYEIADGKINITTSNSVLTAFLRYERCGNLFTRVSQLVVGEAFSLMEQCVQELYHKYKLLRDLQKLVEAAKANVYPWGGGDFDLEELTKSLLGDEEEGSEEGSNDNDTVHTEFPKSSI